MRNSGRRHTIVIEEKADVVRGKDLLDTSSAVTSVSKVYYLVQTALTRADLREKLIPTIQKSLAELATVFGPARVHHIFEAANYVSCSDYYKALRELRPVLEYERMLMNDIAALEFRAKAAEVENPFDILKDKEMASFMRTVLGFPDEMAQVDIDRQAKFIEEAYDLTKLQDPEEVEKLIKRFTIISDAKDGSNVANNPIVQMMSGATSIGSGSFVPITLDISTIDFASLKAYR